MEVLKAYIVNLEEPVRLPFIAASYSEDPTVDKIAAGRIRALRTTVDQERNLRNQIQRNATLGAILGSRRVREVTQPEEVIHPRENGLVWGLTVLPPEEERVVFQFPFWRRDQEPLAIRVEPYTYIFGYPDASSNEFVGTYGFCLQRGNLKDEFEETLLPQPLTSVS